MARSAQRPGDGAGGTDARPRVLLVEDEQELATLVAGVLHGAGYAVDLAGDGQRGLHLGLTHHYEVIVVDRGLPVVDGLEVLRAWRRCGVGTPVLVLTARSAVADRVEGLDAGAEDYLGKPFDLSELLARLRALRRRGQPDAAAEALALPGGRRLDLASRTVEGTDGAVVALSGRECALLALLAGRPEQVFERQTLGERVFGDADPAIVDVYVHYLRRKLGRSVVRTVRGVGYRLGGLR
ncbi:response regulator transcription factor [Parafrankia sp. EUN1f]|uniref:response regulator transcription factor n=1 Tax=Parafrankia sp. EUN1f TaxID=102897 RepID=UPI00067F9051|nr:response regulator transcription factor [Parafrankia sp. EUN1f]